MEHAGYDYRRFQGNPQGKKRDKMDETAGKSWVFPWKIYKA
jgi:hypothetical protein